MKGQKRYTEMPHTTWVPRNTHLNKITRYQNGVGYLPPLHVITAIIVTTINNV